MCQYDELFITQLRNNNSLNTNSNVPEGLFDASSCIQPLFAVTNDGRPFDSSESGFLPEFLGKVFRQTECVITHYVFNAMMIHAINTAPPHALSEEVFTKHFSQSRIRRLTSQWRATPYELDRNGNIVPLFFTHEVFIRTHTPREDQMKGFTVRHWLPTLESLFTANEELAERVFDELLNKNKWISEEDLEAINSEADPYNGYDEMFKHFNQNVVEPVEDGQSLSDIGYSEREIFQFEDPDGDPGE